MISYPFYFWPTGGKITVFQLGYIFEYEFNRRNKFLVSNLLAAVVGGAFKEWVLLYRIIAFTQEWVGVTAFTGSVKGQPFNRVILELMVKLLNALQVIFTGLGGGGGEISPQC